jgi:hypothetical protein
MTLRVLIFLLLACCAAGCRSRFARLHEAAVVDDRAIGLARASAQLTAAMTNDQSNARSFARTEELETTFSAISRCADTHGYSAKYVRYASISARVMNTLTSLRYPAVVTLDVSPVGGGAREPVAAILWGHVDDRFLMSALPSGYAMEFEPEYTTYREVRADVFIKHWRGTLLFIYRKDGAQYRTFLHFHTKSAGEGVPIRIVSQHNGGHAFDTQYPDLSWPGECTTFVDADDHDK